MPDSITYRLGPFHLMSEIALPELPRGEPGAPADVVIRLGNSPDKLQAPLLQTPACEANDQEYLLRVPGNARYYVRGGEQITVEPERGVPELDIRAYLLGSIFAVLCHQRGLLPLHSSAVAGPRGVIAFLGDSGAGKSSLAALLGRRGYGIVADDICLVDPNAPHTERVLPVAPWLKLWQATLDHLGESSADLPPIFSKEDKFRLPLDEPRDPQPLAEVILLDVAAGVAPLQDPPADLSAAVFEPLTTLQAVNTLMRMTYRGYLPWQTGQAGLLFQKCALALAGVHAFRMTRRWGFEHMEAVADAVERHLHR